MNIVFTTIGIIAAFCCIVSNIYTIRMKSAREMHEEYIDGQCLIGKVFTNIFYAPAWLFKIIRFIVVTTIK